MLQRSKVISVVPLKSLLIIHVILPAQSLYLICGKAYIRSKLSRLQHSKLAEVIQRRLAVIPLYRKYARYVCKSEKALAPVSLEQSPQKADIFTAEVFTAVILTEKAVPLIKIISPAFLFFSLCFYVDSCFLIIN